jgi:ligand-binding sensor domain-containing protein
LVLFSLLSIITVLLFASACSDSVTTTSDQPSPELTSNSSAGQVTDWPASATKISPGQHLRFETISLEQGLSLSVVLCMLQDSQGFMWFGTEDGLVKYDGYTLTVYKHDPENPHSVGGNLIQTLFEDDSGTIWVGTRGGGLDRYDRNLDQFIHYRNDPQDSASLSNDDVTAIYQDQDGELWIGTSGGLDRLVLSHRDVSQTEAEGSDQENERFIHYHHDPDHSNSLSSNAVTVIYEDQDGTLWIGTRDAGLNKYDRENERWWHYQNDPSDPHSLSHDNISAVSEDQSGMLWVGTWGGGLDRLVPSTGQALSEAEGSDQENERFVHYHHDPDDPESMSSDEITALYHDQDGVLWIGTYGGGINILDQETVTFAHYQNDPSNPYSLSSNVVWSIFQDREGVLWIGVRDEGINKLGVGSWNFAHYKNDPNNPNSLGDNMIWVLYQGREGDLWTGTMLGGLDRFDRESGNWRHYRHDPDDPGSLSNDWVSAVYEDRSGVVWIGTQSGLDRFEPETETFTHYQADSNGPPRSRSNNVIAIHQGHEDDFWIGTEGGLYIFDHQKESWSQPYRHNPGYSQSLSNDWVLSFLEDRDGTLWIGTANAGLIRFDPETENFAQHQNNPDNPHSLSNNAVLSILQDQKGVLWISTLVGLNRLDPGTGVFTHFREKDGLPNDSPRCILEDRGGKLWVSTTKGLSRFDPQTGTFRNYDVTDGLQSIEFNGFACHMSDSGEMFFGGVNGFNVFFPDRVNDNPTIPPVVLTSLTQGGDEVDLGMTVNRMTDVTFKWPDNAFEFEFAALSFAHPEKNQYAYYLEGFEETWNEVGTRRYGQYTNLPGGTYTLRVKGSNNDGLWNAVGTAVEITIVPPFWQTWWFRGIALLVLVGVVIGGFRLRVRSVEAPWQRSAVVWRAICTIL